MSFRRRVLSQRPAPGFGNSFREMHALRLAYPGDPPDPEEIAALTARYDVDYLLRGYELDFL